MAIVVPAQLCPVLAAVPQCKAGLKGQTETVKVNLFAFFSGLSTWLVLGPSLPPLWGGWGGGVKDGAVTGRLPGRQETDGGADEAKVSERPPAAARSSRPLEDTRPVLLLSPPQGQWRAEGGGDQSWGGG